MSHTHSSHMSHSHSSYLSPDVYFLWRFLEGRTVMVVSHGNTLRAMVKRLDSVSDEDIFHVDLPTAVPIIYDLEACEGGGLEGGGLSVVSEPKGFWGDSKAVRNGRFLMEEKQVRAAQQAMRDQALRDVQVSPYDTEEVVKPVKFADAVSSDVIAVGDKGETYNVRERPPSYFAQESERIASEAELEYANFQVVRRTGRVSGRKKEVKAALTLLRHGYSEWNRANLFTGWKDVDLTIRGREEARRAGRVLKAAGAKRVERVYTSVLSRAVKTAWLMLDEMELQVKRGGGWGVGGGGREGVSLPGREGVSLPHSSVHRSQAPILRILTDAILLISSILPMSQTPNISTCQSPCLPQPMLTTGPMLATFVT